jgi:hypothetical protein
MHTLSSHEHALDVHTCGCARARACVCVCVCVCVCMCTHVPMTCMRLSLSPPPLTVSVCLSAYLSVCLQAVVRLLMWLPGIKPLPGDADQQNKDSGRTNGLK